MRHKPSLVYFGTAIVLGTFTEGVEKRITHLQSTIYHTDIFQKHYGKRENLKVCLSKYDAREQEQAAYDSFYFFPVI